MSYFEFPHTRTYDSDLGWLIRAFKHMGVDVESLLEYKPVVDDLQHKVDALIEDLVKVIVPWDSSKPYNVFDIVEYQGTNYIAVQDVPVGAMITDTTYWQPASTIVEQINAMGLVISEKQDKYWVRPEAYGAEADGTTDDTAAFEDIITNTGYNIRLTPGKTYRVEGLSITRSISIDLNRGTLYAPANDCLIIERTAPGTCIYGGTILGKTTHDTAYTAYAVIVRDLLAEPADYSAFIDGISLRSLHIEGFANGLIGNAVTNFQLADCVFTGQMVNPADTATYGYGALFQSGLNIEIARCVFNGSQYRRHAIYMSGHPSYTDQDLNACRNVNIHDCVFDDSESLHASTSHVAVQARGSDNLLIENCLFHKAAGIGLLTLNSVKACDGVTINNCRFYDPFLEAAQLYVISSIGRGGEALTVSNCVMDYPAGTGVGKSFISTSKNTLILHNIELLGDTQTTLIFTECHLDVRGISAPNQPVAAHLFYPYNGCSGYIEYPKTSASRPLGAFTGLETIEVLDDKYRTLLIQGAAVYSKIFTGVNPSYAQGATTAEQIMTINLTGAPWDGVLLEVNPVSSFPLAAAVEEGAPWKVHFVRQDGEALAASQCSGLITLKNNPKLA